MPFCLQTSLIKTRALSSQSQWTAHSKIAGRIFPLAEMILRMPRGTSQIKIWSEKYARGKTLDYTHGPSEVPALRLEISSLRNYARIDLIRPAIGYKGKDSSRIHYHYSLCSYELYIRAYTNTIQGIWDTLSTFMLQPAISSILAPFVYTLRYHSRYLIVSTLQRESSVSY